MTAIRAGHLRRLLLAASALVALAGQVRAQGLFFPAVGAVNQSMGGASTAAPVDALGTMLWNPATISGIPQSQVDISSAFLIPRIDVSSTSLLGGAGTTRSNSGVVPLANTALLIRSEEMPRLTFGMASYYAAAGGVNFPGDPNNPILAPKFPAAGPAGFVLGPSYASIAVAQTVALVSVEVTDRLSIGGGPMLDAVLAGFDPAFFVAPNNAMGTPLLSFPSATNGRPFWGGGFKVGAYYHLLPKVDVGFGYTSPQWIETMVFNARDQIGNPVAASLPFRLPAIYSLGTSLKPTERLLLAVDCRLIDYINSRPFGLAPAAAGLGWQEVFSVAVGGRYQFGPRLAGMLGYSYNTPTFPSNLSLFNVQAPVITQHYVSVGATARMTENIFTSLTYAYAVRNSVTGSPLQIPGGSTTIAMDAHSIYMTVTVKFGAAQRKVESTPSDVTTASTASAAAPEATSAAGTARVQ